MSSANFITSKIYDISYLFILYNTEFMVFFVRKFMWGPHIFIKPEKGSPSATNVVLLVVITFSIP